jgi:8-oxo-dGTP diphosphatase
MKKYCYEYPKPSVTTDCILVKKSSPASVLLIERKYAPFEGKWALPGGFVEIDEDLEAGAMRELEEETGLANIALCQFKTYGTPGRDPRGRTISVVYYAFIDQEVLPLAGDDATRAEWFPLQTLPPLAFDHQKILEEFMDFMKISTSGRKE